MRGRSGLCPPTTPPQPSTTHNAHTHTHAHTRAQRTGTAGDAVWEPDPNPLDVPNCPGGNGLGH